MNTYRVSATWTNLDGSEGEQHWDLNELYSARYFVWLITEVWPEVGQDYPAITRNNNDIEVNIRLDVLSEGI